MKYINLFRCNIQRRFASFIRFHYKRIQRGIPFVKHHYTVDVKKGKRRYTLLIIENYNGTLLRFNLGRHKTSDCPEQILPL